MLEACRTCLRLIDVDSSPFYEIEDDDVQLSTESCCDKLSSVIPEMVLDITPKSMLCAQCHLSLEAMFEFKALCLETENIIMQYLRAKPDVDIKNLDLKDVSDFNVSHSGDKLVGEVEDFTVKDTGKMKNTEFNRSHETSEIKNTEDEVVEVSDEDVAAEEEVQLCDVDITIVKHDVDDFSSESVEVVQPNDTVVETRVDVRSYNDKILPNEHSEVKEFFVANHWLGFKRFKQTKQRSAVKPWRCETCQVSFEHWWQLNIHRSKHKKAVKPYRCETCQEDFELLSQLKIHRRKHKKAVKPYRCETCLVDFMLLSQLKIHRSKHTKDVTIHQRRSERKFVCNVCGIFYCYETSFRRHMHSHTEHREKHKDVDVVIEGTNTSKCT